MRRSGFRFVWVGRSRVSGLGSGVWGIGYRVASVGAGCVGGDRVCCHRRSLFPQS
jgi:hypothetical protein